MEGIINMEVSISMEVVKEKRLVLVLLWRLV